MKIEDKGVTYVRSIKRKVTLWNFLSTDPFTEHLLSKFFSGHIRKKIFMVKFFLILKKKKFKLYKALFWLLERLKPVLGIIKKFNRKGRPRYNPFRLIRARSYTLALHWIVVGCRAAIKHSFISDLLDEFINILFNFKQSLPFFLRMQLLSEVLKHRRFIRYYFMRWPKKY